MYICVYILQNAHTLVIFVRNVLLIRVTLRNMSVYVMINICLVEMFVNSALVNMFTSIFMLLVGYVLK